MTEVPEHLRKRAEEAKAKAAAKKAAMAAEAAGEAPADDALFWRRAGQRLLDCLAELPPGQRAVFLLHHEDGVSLAEIGVALQLGFETAKSRLRYAMTKLRLCMGAYLPGPGAATS